MVLANPLPLVPFAGDDAPPQFMTTTYPAMRMRIAATLMRSSVISFSAHHYLVQFTAFS